MFLLNSEEIKMAYINKITIIKWLKNQRHHKDRNYIFILGIQLIYGLSGKPIRHSNNEK